MGEGGQGQGQQEVPERKRIEIVFEQIKYIFLVGANLWSDCIFKFHRRTVDNTLKLSQSICVCQFSQMYASEIVEKIV